MQICSLWKHCHNLLFFPLDLFCAHVQLLDVAWTVRPGRNKVLWINWNWLNGIRPFMQPCTARRPCPGLNKAQFAAERVPLRDLAVVFWRWSVTVCYLCCFFGEARGSVCPMTAATPPVHIWQAVVRKWHGAMTLRVSDVPMTLMDSPAALLLTLSRLRLDFPDLWLPELARLTPEDAQIYHEEAASAQTVCLELFTVLQREPWLWRNWMSNMYSNIAKHGIHRLVFYSIFWQLIKVVVHHHNSGNVKCNSTFNWKTTIPDKRLVICPKTSSHFYSYINFVNKWIQPQARK